MSKGKKIVTSIRTYDGREIQLHKAKFLKDGSLLVLHEKGQHDHLYERDNRVKHHIKDEQTGCRTEPDNATLSDIRNRIIKRKKLM